MRRSLIVALAMALLVRPSCGALQPMCRPQTFSYVHDGTGAGLCSAVNGTQRAPDGGSRGDCLRYCAYK